MAAGIAYGRYVTTVDPETGRRLVVRDDDGNRVPNPAGIVFHTTRHTMASLALSDGVPWAVVKRLDAWKTDAVLERYAHLADETMREGAARVAALVPRRPCHTQDTTAVDAENTAKAS